MHRYASIRPNSRLAAQSASASASPSFFRPNTRCSVVQAVRNRELGDMADFRTQVYNSVVPARTFDQVRGLPHVYPVRFTPCGRYFVTISHNHRDLILYNLEGGGPRTAWPRRRGAPPPPDESSKENPDLQSCNFNRFFSHHYTVPVSNAGETLVADFCLASARGRYLVLASYAILPENINQPPPPGDRPNDIPAVSSCPVLQRFTMYLVEVETGCVSDRVTLEYDFVQFEGHVGIHVRGNLLSLLALRSQTLHIFRLCEVMGRIVRERRLGLSCYEDDETEIARVNSRDIPTTQAQPNALAQEGEPNNPAPGGNENNGNVPDGQSGLGNGRCRNAPFGGLMQRLLAHVFREYTKVGNAAKFYKYLALYSELLMLRAQLLDADHVLIELGPEEETFREVGGNTKQHFFLVYCLSSARILHLYSDSSRDLLDIFLLHHSDFFDSPLAAAGARIPSIPEGIGAVASSIYWSSPRRVRRALANLPIRASSNSPSAYLDRSLFIYDMDHPPSRRIKPPFNFTSRRNRTLRFRLGANTPHSRACFIVHPYLPFAISIMATGVARTVIFHTVHA